MSDGTASNNIYIQDKEHGWLPGRIITSTSTTATVLYYTNPPKTSASHFISEKDRRKKKVEEINVDLKDYPSNALPLQNIDEEGKLVEVEDMVDLPFLHEAAILYNLKARHERGLPYTRTGDIVIAVNPYHWIEGLYATETQENYAARLIWEDEGSCPVENTPHTGQKPPQDKSPSKSSKNFDEQQKEKISPHVYETSSLAYRGLASDGQSQSILVSGESGAGKTETVKILMSHLAWIQQGDDKQETASPVKTDSLEHAASTKNIIIKRVLDSNPLLEAFGNAKTSRNDNSSRFGKFIQLQFDCEDPYEAALKGKRFASCVLAGSKCATYLLEKSRVVLHDNRSERSYHIFYQLLAAPDDFLEECWPHLVGKDCEDFTYLGWTDTDTIENKTDEERWGLTVEALATVGIEGEKLMVFMRAVCTVLQLGNLDFEEDPDNEENSVITNEDELEILAQLLGVEKELIRAALTIRTVTARSDVYKVPLNVMAAKDCCDAFAKEIYARMFDWLVRMINDATCAEMNYSDAKSKTASKKKKTKKMKSSPMDLSDTGDYGIIGLLDIFGFESFEVNRFEQLCINYANEKLQQKFTIDIFRSVQYEYEFEGIELGEVTFEDNLTVLNLIEGRMGLISVLNEECVRPRGNDSSFVAKVYAINKEGEGNDVLIHDNFFRETEFGIVHYAGPVTYDSTNFVKKNTDSLPADLADCCKECSNELIKQEILQKLDAQSALSSGAANAGPKPTGRRGGLTPPRTGSKTRRASTGSLVSQTVWTKFRTQLSSLMTNIGETRTRYIRCIKPNREKEPLEMEHSTTIAQLRCAGVVAAVTISRSAFPNRLEHEIVMERFFCLPKPKSGANNDDTPALQDEDADDDGSDSDDSSDDASQPNMRLKVDRLLTSLLAPIATTKSDGTIFKAFVCGKTRVYFRSGSLEYLETKRLTALSDRALLIQTHVRRYAALSYYISLRNASIMVQAKYRAMVCRKCYKRILIACIVVQKSIRCHAAHVEFSRRLRDDKATRIQTRIRVKLAITILKRAISATAIIQAMARGAIQRPIFKIQLAEHIENQKLENKLQLLQKKLEEAEQRRNEAEQKAETTATEAAKAMAENKANAQTTTKTETVVVYRDSPQSKKSDEEGEEKKNEQAALTAEQQTLIDESGKMLEYLRKEVFKLRSQNSQLRRDFDLLRENNQRLMDSNASAGASFAALNQHAKQLNKTNAKLMSELQGQKQNVNKLELVQMELKEELKMKQSTYIAEVHSRFQYQKTMTKIVEYVEKNCKDKNLVEEVLGMSDDCESDFMMGQSEGERMEDDEDEEGAMEEMSSSPNVMDSSSAKKKSGLVGGLLSYMFSSSSGPTIEEDDDEDLTGLEAFGGQFAEA
mmetsp:Transcript_37818/g.55694  ORF Transcript_37818/g.55694 Transcript_37818/m.55694 type:complete len:1372 (+) Transcript_37818:176-4291(+)|eukprot:CAMPEP_0195515904 /NCGR_PEP_ID=MMETSP0794_2-20130614/6804_1 /TAXON_ID=515487 /ORGANISM="Stephanopyxis turris, Strain CCMP 815" /LENGTH=1371 /DNA_ID=CAMNT_0040644399 /DNA_START=176 /DNA_END=4291 /DNA_ORIENTATION=-